MAEEGQLEGEVAVADPTPTPTPTVDFGSAIDNDGNFAEGWRSLLPEDIREESCIKELKTFPVAMKTFVHAHRMVGKDKIALLNENSTDAEREEFYTAIGRPATPEDYSIKRPQDFPETHWSDDYATAAQQLFHKLNLTKEQSDGIVEFNNSNVLQAMKSQEVHDQQTFEEADAALRAKYGDAYPQKVHVGNIAIEQGAGGDNEFKDRIVQKYGTDPDFVELMVNLGSKFTEHGTIPADAMIPTPDDIADEIAKLTATDAYMDPTGKNPEHKSMVERVQRLFRKKNKENISL